MISAVWPTTEHPTRAPFVVRQVEFLRRKGLTVDVVHLDGRRRPDHYAQRWFEVHRRLSRQRYDVVHAHWGQAALVALPKRAPLVITFQGSDLEGIVGADGEYRLDGRILTALSRFAAHRADQVIVVSSRLARHLPDLECHVIPGGLDLDVFKPLPKADVRKQLGLDPTRRYVLFAASPANPVKRHPLAVQAMAELTATHDAELLVVTGVEPNAMPLYMSACDVLLLTSTHEGSPNVVKEALACNLPVVAVEVGDIRERIAHVAGCVMCADDRPATIAAGLRSALDFAQPFAGRESVRDLDEGLLTDRVVAIYGAAIGRSAAER